MAVHKATTAQKRRNREAADWLLRNGNQNQSSAEAASFKEWLDRDPENCRTYRAAERLMGDARRAIQSDPTLSNAEIEHRSARGSIIVTALIACVATGTFFAVDGPMRLEADVLAGVGEMPIVTLADGSQVQLNASSAIAVDFSEKRRIIRLLRGEAFFKVAHAAERPFTVVAGTTSITALGTEFDVRYGRTETEVTVTENAVQIEIDGTTRKTMRVGQGEQAIYDHLKRETAVSPVDELVALSWKRGQIAVDNAPLSYVVEEMNRHFRGRIVVAGSALGNRKVSGTINVSNTDNALGFVTKALGVKATRLGPLVVIRP